MEKVGDIYKLDDYVHGKAEEYARFKQQHGIYEITVKGEVSST